MSGYPSVNFLPGIDPIGAGLVQGETARLQSDTNSKRQAGVEEDSLAQRGQQFQQGLQFQTAEQQQHFTESQRRYEQDRADSIESRIIGEKLSQQRLKAEFQLKDLAARRTAKAIAGEMELDAAGQEEEAGINRQLEEIDAQLPKYQALEAFRQSPETFGKVYDGIKQLQAADLIHANNLIPAVQAALESSLTAEPPPSRRGAEPPSRATAEAGVGVKGTAYPVTANSEAMQPTTGTEAVDPTGGGQVAANLTENVLTKMGFPEGQLQGGRAILHTMLASLEEAAVKSGSDPNGSKAATEAARQSYKMLKDQYGISEKTMNVLFGMMEKSGREYKHGLRSAKTEGLAGQVKAGEAGALKGPPVDVNVNAPQAEVMRKMGLMGLNALSEGKQFGYRIGKDSVEIDPNQHMPEVMAQVVADLVDNGFIDDPSKLEQLSPELKKAVREKSTLYQIELKTRYADPAKVSMDEIGLPGELGTRGLSKRSALEERKGKLGAKTTRAAGRVRGDATAEFLGGQRDVLGEMVSGEDEAVGRLEKMKRR